MLRKGKILIVDDVRINRESLRRRVEKVGHSSELAANGEEALEKLGAEKFDLVLLDVMMPGMDGYDVLERIEADDVMREIPVIMISSLDEMESVIRCIAAGAEDYLPKDVDLILLQARINSSLERKYWRDRQREHVDRVVDAMGEIEKGQINTTLVVDGDDLYARLYRGFNLMTGGLQDASRILEIAQELSGEMHLDVLLRRIMSATTDLLDADRSTLYVCDKKTGELWSLVAEGMGVTEIRIPPDQGLAGLAFTGLETLNISDPYNHPAFDPSFDQQSGYKTESILCMPIVNKLGEGIGVTQVLNKNGGNFSQQDEDRLKAFTSQIAVTLDNAQLFDDVLSIKNYNESILKSMSNGLITLDTERNIVTVNEMALSILKVEGAELVDRAVSEIFHGDNQWVVEGIDKVERTGGEDSAINVDLVLGNGEIASVNLTTVPLIDAASENIGSMIIIEDITDEKRVKTTMARYMSKEIADQLLEQGEAELGGKAQRVSVLFSDLRQFTTISESLGPRETVELLNAYFTDMVDVIFKHKGILDKYIGDAIMALFGAPLEHPDDADNALAVANDMLIAVNAINQKRALQSLPAIDIGIGISTGSVVAGSIGSPKRMEYTVIGDSVNLAARLESANKFYGTNILLSEHTVRDLKNPENIREIDSIRVKGKEQPIAVFESVGFHTSDSFPNMADVMESYAEGLGYFRGRDWQKAVVAFERTLEARSNDGPASIQLGRCRSFIETPPPETRDGVWEFTEK